MNYIDNLRDLAAKLPNGKTFNARINFMQHIVEALQQQELPKHRFPQFELTQSDIESNLENYYLVDPINFQSYSDILEEFDHQLSEFRTVLQNEFGYWATITADLMDDWSTLFPNFKYLEIMAGNGYVSKGFRQNNISSICTDNLSWSKQSPTGHVPVTSIERLDAIAALKKYNQQVDAVVLAWSPDREEIDYEILQYIRQTNLYFFVIGEKYGATNSKKFWDAAAVVNNDRVQQLNKVYSNYDLVHDKIFLIK